MAEPRGKKITRREFIRQTAKGAGTSAVALTAFGAIGHGGSAVDGAPAFQKTLGANDLIAVGVIGTGGRGQDLMMSTRMLEGVQIVALCDVYSGHLQRALELTSNKAATFKDYRDLLARQDIDAVIIATPDHWHKQMVIDSLRAGKDVYIEKPMTWSIEEGPEIIKEAERSGKIVQVGSQYRSSLVYAKAREIIQSGRIGKVTMIRGTYDRNSTTGAWVYPIPPDASPETIDWEKFLGPAPKRDFDPKRFFRWRCYWDYSGGIPTDLFVHLLTGINYVMGTGAPRTALAQGQLYRWKDREVPDTFNALYEYDEGFTVYLSTTFNNASSGFGTYFLGLEGTLELKGNQITIYSERFDDSVPPAPRHWPKATREAYNAKHGIQERRLEGFEGWGEFRGRLTTPKVLSAGEKYEIVGADDTRAHLQNFFDSVRTRQASVEDAVIGHNAALGAHLANLSFRHKKQVVYDSAKQMAKV